MSCKNLTEDQKALLFGQFDTTELTTSEMKAISGAGYGGGPPSIPSDDCAPAPPPSPGPVSPYG